MKPVHRRPGKRPFWREARTIARDRIVMDKKMHLLKKYFETIEEMDYSLSEQLRKFLIKKGMRKKRREAVRIKVAKLRDALLEESIDGFAKRSITPKEQAEILKNARIFLAAIEEAKDKGII